MRATSSPDRNGGRAELAFLHRRRRRSLQSMAHRIDPPDQQEDRKCHDEKADDRVDEEPVIERDGPCPLRIGNCDVRSWPRTLLQDDEEIRCIHAAEQQSDRRHEHIVDQTLHDCAEGASDDDDSPRTGAADF